MDADARKTRGIHRLGTREEQPAATTVLNGTLYFVTDENEIERSNGITWESFSLNELSTLLIAALTLQSAAPTLQMLDTTASAKSLKVVTDANKTHFYEVAGAAGDVLTLDLTNKRVGVGTASPQAKFAVALQTTADATAQSVLSLYAGSSEVVLAGFGTRFGFDAENAAGAFENISTIGGIWENPASGNETGAIVMHTRVNGGAFVERVRISGNGNLGINTTSFGTDAVAVLAIKNGTPPTSSPAGVGQLYVEAGILKYRGSSGTITTLGDA